MFCIPTSGLVLVLVGCLDSTNFGGRFKKVCGFGTGEDTFGKKESALSTGEGEPDADSVDPFQTTLLPLDFAGVALPFEATDRLHLFKIRYIKAFLHTHIIKPPHEKSTAR